MPITLLDTAGLRQSGDLVERIGVERSLAAARAADIVLMVVDAQAGWCDADAGIFQQARPVCCCISRVTRASSLAKSCGITG